MSTWPQVLIDLFRLSIWLLILVIIFVPLERLFAVQPSKLLRKGIGVDIGYYFLNSLSSSALMSLPFAMLAWVAHRGVPTSVLEATASLSFGSKIVVGMVIGEIGYYWGHRLSHEIPFLWRFHAIHHSAEHLDFLVNSRAHPVDMVFGRFCMLVPLYVLGLATPFAEPGTKVAIAASLIGGLWSFFIHANIRWRFGPLEWLVSTPAFHHWHHTKSGPINRNYSSTFPWIDKFFGTLYLPNEWPADYGIKTKMPDSLADQLFYPITPEHVSTSDASVSTSETRIEESVSENTATSVQ